MAAHRVPLAERLERNSMPEPNTRCRLWCGAAWDGGYGHIKVGRKTMAVHRAAWVEANGRPVPLGMLVCHKCDVKLCIEPLDLFLGTTQDNVNDKMAKGRFVKKRGGHKLTEDQVRAILIDPRSYRQIAPDYGVHPPMICRIKRRETWKHVEVSRGCD